MTARELTNIALRVLGILWCGSALAAMPQFFWLDTATAQTRHMVIGSAISTVLFVVLGLLLFFGSRTLASKIVPSTEPLHVDASAADFQAIGFSLLGVYFALGAAGRLAGLLYVFSRQEAIGSRFQQVWVMYPERIITTAVELIIAILLFFGSRDLSGFWSRLRGRTAAPPESL